MTDSRPASILTQADALLRKNLVFQKRNIWSNVRLVTIPFFLCLLLVVIQLLFDSQFNEDHGQCGCLNEKTCGLRYSTSDQAAFCAIPNPSQWTPLLQIPSPQYRAATTLYLSLSSPVTFLFTGNNQSLGETLMRNMYSNSPEFGGDLANYVLVTLMRNMYSNSPEFGGDLANYVLGSSSLPAYTNYMDSSFISDLPIYNIKHKCSPNSSFSILIHQPPLSFPKEITCVRGLNLWRNSTFDVNKELFKGYRKGNQEEKINEYTAAFDFQNTNGSRLNVNVWYNSTYKNNTVIRPMALIRVPRLVNLASNAYLEFLKGSQTKILFEYIKEMPKPETKLTLDITSLIGPLFFTWVILLLFPVILTTLVYEKQQRLRIMMKMHGLGDAPYWIVSYTYFVLVSILYMLCFAVFGSAIGLNFFRLNDYSIQLVFFLISINLQISVAFLVSAMFSDVKTATGKDGNPQKLAVRGLSLALPQGECFGMLGPNGAGKTSFINMMTGIIKPSSGSAFVQGLDILTDMDRIYTTTGVCPQHDLLWDKLSGREHLLFYGRLKNLQGSVLTQAVEESLRSVNLFHGGNGDKQIRRYSGGMKRRLSVAISLIGNPKVVYMDEPSTGLDPASRKSLWDVVKRAKRKGSIILTTHSMEEAEVLCDRLGIFVNGSLQCIGNPKELKGRYGGSYVLTMTTSEEHEQEVEKLVHSFSKNAKKIYRTLGTQKFELPRKETKIAEVFQAVEKAKKMFPVVAWGLADTTLEDVFVKVAQTS
ncbi:hypothetical protein F2Q70_00011248 [Brassica cretica]|uniref:ABC transporter domain-containing protein n=1 Tax=Brassica cretica TaxID=69181 RepID=A0A8S9LX58_BRACR|nr:hypothetical protein F2Q70_00011248 [Brassica cretica]